MRHALLVQAPPGSSIRRHAFLAFLASIASIVFGLAACGGGSGGGSVDSTPPAPVAPQPATVVAAPPPYVDRLDFGAAASERSHGVNLDTTNATSAVGAFAQSYRQPKLVAYGTAPGAADKLAFTVGVDPVRQNYLTVKLFGSDTQFGVLHLADLTSSAGEVVFDQLDNNISNSASNPAFQGRFHYATTALPLSMTAGKASVTLSLVSTGYYYDSGRDRAGQATRPVYSAFVHTDPFFTPPSGEPTGPALVQVGTQPPVALDRAVVFNILKRSRADIYGLDGVPDGFWNPGGTLANHGSVIPAGTSGAPREVIGMHMWDGPLTASQIADINATPNPADTWRANVVGRQSTAISLYTTLYLTPPLKDIAGNIVPGYDRYLDPTMLDRLIGLIDGQARSQGGGTDDLAGWDTGCWSGVGWSGVTSAPRTSGAWAGTTGRHDAGCLSFSDPWTSGRAILRLLDDPQAAAALRTRLAQRIDADLDGRLVTRAAMYQRMLASSANAMGFRLKALTSADNFDKFGGTAAQAMIWVGNAYPAQLALRSLATMFPTADADKQPMDPATLRTIVRQLLGLADMVFMAPATPGWRIITRGGIAETYGSLASGYDGRYGGGVPQDVAKFAVLTRYDAAMSADDRAQVAAVARNTIAAFDNFLYPQHRISTASDGSVVDSYALGQEDVISWRVPYGPNANGWNLNLQTLAVDPNGPIQSTLARRSFLLNAARGAAGSLITDMDNYTAGEAAWSSIAGVDPATVPMLPGEPGAADFVWADVDSGAFAMHFRGERLFFNANYNRGKGSVDQFVRLHHATELVDRQATVRMPFDATTVQGDGNLSGDFDGAWIVRYGRYLVALNRSATATRVTMPPGTGSATSVRAGTTVPLGGAATVAAGGYEVFVLP